MSIKLGVNIDHVATVRQARQVQYPDPVEAARVAEAAGADQITVHIRMDRRHIQESDLVGLKAAVRTRLNVEMAATDEMMKIAAATVPEQITLVPERAGEVTTEGGLDLARDGALEEVAAAVHRLQELGIEVAIFADPDREQVEGVLATGADSVEFNTAAYADAASPEEAQVQLQRLAAAARLAQQSGIFVAAGHGLHYRNIGPLVELNLFREFNIGHSLVAQSIFSGLGAAVRDMKALLS